MWYPSKRVFVLVELDSCQAASVIVVVKFILLYIFRMYRRSGKLNISEYREEPVLSLNVKKVRVELQD